MYAYRLMFIAEPEEFLDSGLCIADLDDHVRLLYALDGACKFTVEVKLRHLGHMHLVSSLVLHFANEWRREGKEHNR